MLREKRDVSAITENKDEPAKGSGKDGESRDSSGKPGLREGELHGKGGRSLNSCSEGSRGQDDRVSSRDSGSKQANSN